MAEHRREKGAQALSVKTTLRTAGAAAAVCAAGVFILGRPAAVAQAVRSAAESCLEVVVPSLFAFTVLAVFLRDSGLYRIVLKPLTLPLSRLLRMDEELCAYIVLGNIGGYPVGAKLLAQAVEERRISERDAGRLLCCCFGSGPSFVIGIVGVRVFASAAVGGAVFAACFMASFVIAAAVRAQGEITLLGKSGSAAPSAGCFIGSVMTGARVMFTVCAMITAFSVMIAFAEEAGLLRLFAKAAQGLGAGADSAEILPALLEVSRIGGLSGDSALCVPLCAGMLSLGGVCVLLQVAALSGKIPLRGFLLSRLPAAALSAAFSAPACFIPRAAAAALPAGGTFRAFSSGTAVSVCVLIMSGILLAGNIRVTRGGK